jgi:glyoxylase-like metal-dependent hydrolase (beta-lactamase superfamily II)
MSTSKFESRTITDAFIQLGVPEFPMYLSKGERFMLIEGGTGATVDIVVRQLEELGTDPERIDSILLTHSHPDHIGGYPRLRKLWPHIKIKASSVAKQILAREELIKQFLFVDKAAAKIMVDKGQLDRVPERLEQYDFSVDEVVGEGDIIDLGSGIEWTVHDVPGHAPCQIALHEKKEGTLVIGDATGFYSPQREVWWPNYFVSLEGYCRSIQKLMSIPAKRIALSHNGVVENPAGYLRKALQATEKWHLEMMERISRGEEPEAIAEDKAQWVDSFANILPIQIQKDMCLLMIKRSQKDADKPGLFG